MNIKKYFDKLSKNYYLTVFILGIITALVIFLPFMIYDHGLFLYYGDFDVQQIPFYKLAHDSILSGNSAWNWNTDLGVNFVGSYSFYLLGSPFFWITLLFPSAAVPYLMAPLLILKFGLTCVTGYAFINRFTKYSGTAMLGALLYAFSGFNIYNIFFNHFHEVVLVFPLLLIALEELVINNRRGGFALTVALCALINYYFFFGEVIFVVIYFIVRCTSKDFNANFKKFLLIFLEAVIGLLMSAILLVPAILAIAGNTRLGDTLTGFDMLFYDNPQRYGLIFGSFLFPPDIPARPNFFPDSNAKWSSVSMFLPLFSISGVIAFFKGKGKHWAKKLIPICVLISVIPILNAAFSAFNYSYYARWFYMPILIMAMMTAIALEGDSKHLKFGLIINAVLVGAFSLIGILPKKENDVLKWFSLPEYPERFWLYVIIAVIGIMLCGMFLAYGKKNKKVLKVAISLTLCVTVTYSIIMIYSGKLAGDGYETVGVKALHGSENIDLKDDEFFRIDTFDELDNLGMYWNMPTINAFHSIVPASISEYYKAVGEERGVASRPKTSKIGVRGLLNVKYSFIKTDNGTANSLVGFEYFDEQNGYDIYKNEHFVPMGVTYDNFMLKQQFEGCTDQNRDRLFLKGIMLSEDDYENYKHLLPTLSNDEIGGSAIYDDQYFADCDELAKNAVTKFEYDGSGFSAEIDSDKENLVFFSVPYDKGFSATVNMNPVEIVKANEGFMAVKVPEGGSIIQFTYKTPGLNVGIIITIIASVMLIGYLLLIRYLRKKGKALKYDRFAHLRNDNYDVDIMAHDAYINKICTFKRKADEKLEENSNDSTLDEMK